MKFRFALAALALMPTIALAADQVTAVPAGAVTAADILGQSVGRCMAQNAQLVEQMSAIVAENNRLQKQVADLQKATQPPAAPPAAEKE